MDLYDKTILDLNSNPPNFVDREDAQHVVKAYNAYCGDKFKVNLDFDKRAGEISFMGYGCAVSKASTAVMTECLREKSWVQIVDICVTVLDFLNGGGDGANSTNHAIKHIDIRLESFAVVHKYPGRYDCAALCWEEMRKYALKQQDCAD